MDQVCFVCDKVCFGVQVLIGVWLVVGLVMYMVVVGLIGFLVIVLVIFMSGVIEEYVLGKVFEEVLLFIVLLCVFFGVVVVIIEQGLFVLVIYWVLGFEGIIQLVMFYLVNGVLLMVSDNVFVGLVYIIEVSIVLVNGEIICDQFDLLVVVINIGINLFSVVILNGQVVFLFLLILVIVLLLRFFYGCMVFMVLLYIIVLVIVGLLVIYWGLVDIIQWFYDMYLIEYYIGVFGVDNSGYQEQYKEWVC